MVDKASVHRIIRKIHIYSAFSIAFLLMYFITGFLTTRVNIFRPGNEETIRTEYPLSLPDGMADEAYAAYVQEQFGIKGHTEKMQVNGKGEILIPYRRPGMRYQAKIPADRKTIEISSSSTNMRSKLVIMHRLHGYGGGLIYDLYILMEDLTGIAVIIFSLTGLYLGLADGKDLIPKLLLLAVGVGFTIMVIISFMRA